MGAWVGWVNPSYLATQQPKQLIYRPPCHRILPVGRDLRERLQDKPSLSEPWMRYDEIRRVDDVVVVEDQIQIERSRRTGKRAFATESLLDVEQSDEQIVRRERRLPYCRRVEEGCLLADADGSRVVKTRDAKRLDEWAQRVECGAQIGFAVADVAAERDRDPDDRLLLPARGQHRANALGTDRPLPDHVFHARGRLLEQSLMLD